MLIILKSVEWIINGLPFTRLFTSIKLGLKKFTNQSRKEREAIEINELMKRRMAENAKIEEGKKTKEGEKTTNSEKESGMMA